MRRESSSAKTVSSLAVGAGRSIQNSTKRGKVARAEKHDDFILVLGGVDRVVHAKAGKSDSARATRVDLARPVIEQGRVERDFVHAVRRQLVDLDRLLEK